MFMTVTKKGGTNMRVLIVSKRWITVAKNVKKNATNFPLFLRDTGTEFC